MTQKYDIIIAGGSYIGLTQAVAIAHALRDAVRVVVIDPNNPGITAPSQRADVRASAIAAASQRLLTTLGIWVDLEAVAQPVTAIELTDSRLADVIRPTLLTYDNTLASGDTATFIAENSHIRMALCAAVSRAGKAIETVTGTISDVTTTSTGATVTLTDGRKLKATLLIAADGKRSRVRAAAGIKSIAWTYPQTGIVTIIAHEKPHAGHAVQHFLPSGPFATLPLRGDRSCITWSEDTTEANRILALPDAAFLAEIARRLGNRLGQLSLAGGRQSWPLDMHLTLRMDGRPHRPDRRYGP